MSLFDSFTQRNWCFVPVLIVWGLCLPASVVLCDLSYGYPGNNYSSDQSRLDHRRLSQLSKKAVAVVNGSPLATDYFPALTALVTGRNASIELNQQLQVEGFFFGHGLNAAFAGEVIDCGSASGLCSGAENKICLINSDADSALDSDSDLSPAEQLEHCALAQGVGAVYWSTGSAFQRTDMFDGLPTIPAVFINELQSISVLNEAMSSGTLYLEVESQVAQTIHCGATYLGGRWVLTAAHCVLEITPDGARKIQPWEITASVGAHDLRQDTHLTQSIQAIYLIEDSTSGVTGDVALLELSDEPMLSAPLFSSTGDTSPVVNLASSASVNLEITGAGEALVLGWGSTQIREPDETVSVYDTTSPVPLLAPVTLISPGQCRDRWFDYLGDSLHLLDVPDIEDMLLCAYDPVTRHDTCQGDSGGPLLVEVQGRLELAGLTSFGVGCGSADPVPAVYTRISEYAGWIEQTTGLKLMSSTEPAVSIGTAPLVTVNSPAVDSRVATSGVGKNGGGSIGFMIVFPLLGGLLFLSFGRSRL